MWAGIAIICKRNEFLRICSWCCYCCSVTKFCPTLCDPIAVAHQARLSSLSPRVCSNSHPLSWWCYPSNLLLYWSLYWSFSFSISPTKNIQGWFPLGLTSFISLYSSFLASSTSWTVLKGKQIWYHKMSPQVGRCPICYWWRMESNY